MGEVRRINHVGKKPKPRLPRCCACHEVIARQKGCTVEVTVHPTVRVLLDGRIERGEQETVRWWCKLCSRYL